MAVVSFKYLPKVLKAVQISNLTGLLLGRNGEQGAALVFKEGRLIHAQMGPGNDNAEGDDALYSLLAWHDGQLKWQTRQVDTVPTIDDLQEDAFYEALGYLIANGSFADAHISDSDLADFFGPSTAAPASPTPSLPNATITPVIPPTNARSQAGRVATPPLPVSQPPHQNGNEAAALPPKASSAVPPLPASPAPFPTQTFDSPPNSAANGPVPAEPLPPRAMVGALPASPAPFPDAGLAATPQPVPAGGSSVATLIRMGVPRLNSEKRFSLNSHFANVVHVAREVADTQWSKVVQAALLSQYFYDDPPNDTEHTTPLEYFSQLNYGFEQVFGSKAPEKLRQWGRVATERSLKLRKSSGTEQRIIKLLPGKQRKLTILLNSFTKAMDEVRGEHLHTWKQIDNTQFWLVHYNNLYTLGRRRKSNSCFVWTASFQAMLRWAGMENEWFVEEIECGCVNGTYDCVFAIRNVQS